MPPGARKSLDRALSRAGLCSRSEAAARIAAGRVQVNGRTVRDPEAFVDVGRDRICCDGQPLRAAAKQCVMLHKPAGYVTTRSDEHGRATVYDLLPPDLGWLGPVGRLDQDTSGLLLFTNDSDLAHAITDPASHLAKTYAVHCRGALPDAALERLRQGLVLDDGPTRPARCTLVARGEHTTDLLLAIDEGRNRQVRRMLQAVGSQVLALHRTRIGPLALGDLPAGQCRPLTPAELQQLRAAVSRARPAGRTGRGGSGSAPPARRP